MDQLGSLHLHQPLTILMQQLKCIPSQLFNKKLLLILIYECLFLNCNIRPSSLKVESMKKGRRSKSSVPWSYYRVWQRESNARSLELIGGFSRRRSESEGSICKEAYLSIEAFFSLSQCILSTRSRHNKGAREKDLLQQQCRA